MPRPKFDSERARAAGIRSAEARALARLDRARSHLTLSRVEAELPPLRTLESAKQRLDRIGTWAMAGLLPGVVAMAAVRACEVWVRTHEAGITQELAEKTKARLDTIEAELGRSRMGIAR